MWDSERWLCMIRDRKWDFRDLSWEFNKSIRRSVHCLCMIICILWKHQPIRARDADHTAQNCFWLFSCQNRKLMYSDWTSPSNKSNSESFICILQSVQQRPLLHLTMCVSDWSSFSFSFIKRSLRNLEDFVDHRREKSYRTDVVSELCSLFWHLM